MLIFFIYCSVYSFVLSYLLYFCGGNIAITLQKLIFMDSKLLFGLFLETCLADDVTKEIFVHPSSGSTQCICASYDEEKLKQYALTLNSAEEIRVKLLPFSIVSHFVVKPLRFID